MSIKQTLIKKEIEKNLSMVDVEKSCEILD